MRVYLSSTSLDLGDYRSAVIGALRRSGHTPVCMEDHAAASVVPKEEVIREVAECQLYVGIFAWRYGFVPCGSKSSITEMEFREAERLNIETLIFLLDENADWPSEYRDVGENGTRITELRKELQERKWIRFFSNPDNLTAEVLAAIMRVQFIGARNPKSEEKERQRAELERLQEDQAKEKYRRERKGRDRVPVPIPEKHVLHFQDRETELSRLRLCLADKNVRMAVICGRAGSGKTTLAAKLIRELTDETIVYVSLSDSENRSLDRIIQLVSRTLGDEAATHLKDFWKQSDVSLQERLAVLFRHQLSHHQCLIVLDNLESVLDDDNWIRPEYAALRQFIEAFLEYAHEAVLIITSRRAVRLSRDAEIAAIGRSVQIQLDEGLPDSHAIALLRELDPDGRLGILGATDVDLTNIVRRCNGIPRTLETLVVNLSQHPTWTLDTLLGNETKLTPILDNPAREVYTGLSSDQERLVMQALAIYEKPVPGAAIRFVLPALPIEEILDKLVCNFVVNYDDVRKRYWLHALDCEYGYSQIPVHGSDYSKPALHKLAAQFYRSFPCPPREHRTSFDDIMPTLDAVEHLLAADQAEEAVALLFDNGIDEDLDCWGHYLTLTDLYRRLLSHTIPPEQKIALHIKLGKINRNLGELETARKTYETALPLIGEAAGPDSEIGLHVALGDISFYLGNLDRALEYHQRAEDLLVRNPIPRLQSENAGDLANVLLAKGEYEKAQRFYDRAISFSRDDNNKIYEGIWNGDLANLNVALFKKTGDTVYCERAISLYLQAIAIAKETQDRRHESHWSGVLGNLYRQVGEYDLAKDHLSQAMAISQAISYRHISTQVKWLAATFGESTQRCVQNQDFESAFQVCRAFLEEADEIGNAELKEEAKRQFSILAINKVSYLFQEGRTGEAIAKGREFLESWTGNAETCGDLGSISALWGRRDGNREDLRFSVEAYSKGITLGSGDSVGGLYEGRANACSLLGRIEEAIADYGEAIRLEPNNIGAALSRAEVLVWAGRYDEALLSLESLHQRLGTAEEKAIGAWLMCHALNLANQDYSAFRKMLEDAQKETVELKYSVTDIEPYLKQLDRTTFSETQIQNAWRIQRLIRQLEKDAS